MAVDVTCVPFYGKRCDIQRIRKGADVTSSAFRGALAALTAAATPRKRLRLPVKAGIEFLGNGQYLRVMTPEALLRTTCTREAVPFVGEITLLVASQPTGLWDIWSASERDAPPFWVFPWAGGQALARYVLDNPRTVRGRYVFDVASGSGLVAIAAAKAGAASVVAGDIDPGAVAAIRANAEANGVTVTARAFDLMTDDPVQADVVLAGDVFYQRELASAALAFLRRAAGHGAEVLAADPGRAFVPAAFLSPLARYQVPVSTTIEDKPVKDVTVYRLARELAPEAEST